MTARNEILNAVCRELRQAGVGYQIDKGRHIKIKAEGLARLIVVSRSSSDVNAIHNAIALVRRKIRMAKNAG